MMKKLLPILFFAGFLTCCNEQPPTPIITENIKQPNEEIDTIIEKNNPNSLDLSRHQLFIDTTRASVYHKRSENPKPFNNRDSTTINFINYVTKEVKPKKVNLKKFPRLWLTLHQYKGEFMFYDRCDGSDPSYEFTDKTFNIYGPLEFDADGIKKIIKLSDNKIELELGIIKEKSENGIGKVSITMTKDKGVYILNYTHNRDSEFVTPIENFRNFDVLVNHCPVNKVREFSNKFDK